MPDTFATSSDGLLLVANGIDAVLRWDGLSDEMQPAGVDAPDAAPTLAASGAGSISGTYRAYLRYVDDRGNFSNLSPVSSDVTAASALTFGYSGIETPSSQPKVRRRQLLRNTTGQARVYYVDVDTEDLTSTSFSSTKTDAQLRTQEAVSLFDTSNNDISQVYGLPPDTKKFVAAHHERLFLGGEEPYDLGSVAVTFGSTSVQGHGTEWPSNLAGRFLWLPTAEELYEVESVDAQAQTLTLAEAYQGPTTAYTPYSIRAAAAERRVINFSGAGLPESWSPFDGVSPQEDGDEITGLMSKGSFLYILERRHIYRLTFQDSPDEDGFIFLTAGRGCINNRCWCVVDDRAFLLDEAGVYAFQGGQQVEGLSDPIQDLFEPSRGTRLGRYKIRWEASRWFSCCFDPGSRVVRWFVTLSGTGIPRHALCLDISRAVWWVEEYPFPVGAAAVAPLRGGRRVLVGGPGGRTYALGQGTLDCVDGDEMTCRGTVTSAGVRSLTDSSATFTSAAVNAPVAITEGRGKGQWRVITDVTSTRLGLDRPWTSKPDSTSVYQLGGVRYQYRTGWFRYAAGDRENPRRLEIVFEPAAYSCTLDARLYLDRSADPVVWAMSQDATAGDGFAVAAGEADWVADLAKPIGVVQRRVDGWKEHYLDGPRLSSWEFAGVTNRDTVTIYEVTIDGVVGR